jgi:hypothetical protein
MPVEGETARRRDDAPLSANAVGSDRAPLVMHSRAHPDDDTAATTPQTPDVFA